MLQIEPDGVWNLWSTKCPALFPTTSNRSGRRWADGESCGYGWGSTNSIPFFIPSCPCRWAPKHLSLNWTVSIERVITSSQIQPCIYILASGLNGTLYIGVTSRLYDRVSMHKLGMVDGFTKDHDVHLLVYYEIFSTMEEAISREKSSRNGTVFGRSD